MGRGFFVKNASFFTGKKKVDHVVFQKKTSVEMFCCWMIWMKSYQKLP